MKWADFACNAIADVGRAASITQKILRRAEREAMTG
jgi:hypothetical protein